MKDCQIILMTWLSHPFYQVTSKRVSLYFNIDLVIENFLYNLTSQKDGYDLVLSYSGVKEYLLRYRILLGPSGGELLCERRLALVQKQLRIHLVGGNSGHDRSASGYLLLGVDMDSFCFGAGKGLLRARDRGYEGVKLGG
eukprot:Mrub_08384.p1 GENE.Mrub_08384~~Mrub_08384.p1  ORF type:complete len:140 (+),score=17.68 Mrub_08384:277-696(+)